MRFKKIMTGLIAFIAFSIALQCHNGISSKADNILLFRGNKLYGLKKTGVAARLDSLKESGIYFIRFYDTLDASEYYIIDTIPGIQALKRVNSNDKIVVYAKEIADRCHFIKGYLSETYKADTIYTFIYSKEHWLEMNYLSFEYNNNNGSMLLISYNALRDSPLSSIEILLIKIKGNGMVDTLTTITNALCANFSADGTQLLIDYILDIGVDGFPQTNIGIYDILNKSMEMPLDTEDCSNHWGQSVDSHLPIYYLKEQYSVNRRNVWKYDSINGEMQLTFYDAPNFVQSFSLERDSLICLINKYGSVGVASIKRVAYTIGDI